MAGPGEARPVGNRVSTWNAAARDELPGELLLTGPCHINVLYREHANKRERERERDE